MNNRTTRRAALGLLLLCGGTARAQLTALPGHPAPSPVIAAEYFIGADPGFGNGQALPLSAGLDIASNSVIPISQFAPGAYRIHLRSRNAAGLWSHTQERIIVIYSLITALPQMAAPLPVDRAEYFIDTDPGYGHGVALSLPGPGADLSAANVPIDVSGLPPGLHRISFRSRDMAGHWSLSSGSNFSILVATLPTLPAHPAIRPVTAIEYFIDTDPGWGNGTIVTIPATTDLPNETIAVDITGLRTGVHTLFMRSLNGHSMTSAQSFSINGTALPLQWTSFTATSASDHNRLDWQLADGRKTGQFRIERSADGRQFSKIGRMDASQRPTGRQDYSYRDAAPLPGVSYYRVILELPDGSEAHSPVMSLRRGSANAEVRINNPVANSLMIRRLGDGAAALDLRIRNLSGGDVLHPGRSNEALQQVDVSALPAGMYILSWSTSGRSEALRFIKQ